MLEEELRQWQRPLSDEARAALAAEFARLRILYSPQAVKSRMRNFWER